MKNRFSRMGNALLGAMCLLTTCGLSYSCSDDYDLDDTNPSFLGGSIYDELKSRGNFETTIKLIDDLDYADVMSKTGSKTLFVANDDAYANFFQTTTWTDGQGQPVRSYNQLSTNQKRLLLFNSMLNNAYVMEMMANTSGGGTNECLRQVTQAAATDSVGYWRWDQLPVNEYVATEGEDDYPDFWASYRQQSRGGIYMALDATQPMLTHFLEGQMRSKNISNDDIAFILGLPEGSWGNENRSYIYNAQVTEQDVTCLNGYFHVLDRVLQTPTNMAEVIRTNGKTKHFSRMLDRFSAPFYNANLTQQYQALHPSMSLNDSVFEKRYFAVRSQGGNQLSTTPDGEAMPGAYPYLAFDPGWNEYSASSTEAKEVDMGVIFAPSDAAIEQYFLQGSGVALLNRYAKETPVTLQNLDYNLDQLPLTIVRSLVNNLMKTSFNESVPSKYLTIMNDARDQMFPATSYPSVSDFKTKLVDTCLLANNGLVYVINEVVAPADYASVIAPVLTSQNAQVMRAVITADDNYVNGSQYNQAPLQKYFSTYLKSMQSHFSLFVPTDDGLSTYGYVNPMSLASGMAGQYNYLRFSFSNFTASDNQKRLPIEASAYSYNMETGPSQSDVRIWRNESREAITSGRGDTKASLLEEMVDQHIVVQEDADVIGQSENAQRYYLSRSGAPIYIAKPSNATNGLGMEVKGGFQLMLDAQNSAAAYSSVVTEGYDQTGGSEEAYGNGMTYFLNRPMQPTMNTVFDVMSENEEYSDFYNLCLCGGTTTAPYDADLLNACGFRLNEEGNLMDDSDWYYERMKYQIFLTEGVISGSTSNNCYPPSGSAVVRFFNNYNYTVYIPTNDAVQAAINNGLPTWDDITNFVNSCERYEAGVTDDEGNDMEGIIIDENERAQAQAMVTELVNFLKYHFQDLSVFVDNVTSVGEDNGYDSYSTSCIDNELGSYLMLHVRQTPGTMTVLDNAGTTHNVTSLSNVVARDMNFNARVTAGESCSSIKNSSYVVVHQIDGALDFRKGAAGASYSSAWETPAKAKAFIRKYEIRK